MLTLWGKSRGSCCDGIGRRDFMRIGALGLGGMALSDVLRAKAAGTVASSSPAKSVILFWLDGGPTHMETYDPKPDAPAEYRGPLGVTQTSVPGIQIGELLTGHARHMDKFSIVRSVHHDNGDHFAAAHWMLTGYHGSNAVNQDPQYPGVGAVVSRLRGSNHPNVPAHVTVPYSMTVGIRPGYNGGAFLGVPFNPFDAGSDPNNANFSVPNLTMPGGMDLSRLGQRRDLLSGLDRMRRDADRTGLMNGMDAFSSRAFDMLTGNEAREAFAIDREDPRLRDRYGRNTHGQSALLARRLVESGVTFVTIHNGGWDHHNQIGQGMEQRLPSMDCAVSTLIADLHERGMLNDTMVLVMGEFGRTPRVNQDAGRDHWGNSMSVMIGGGGLQSGRIVGATNAKGEHPVEAACMPADILATIYRQLGVDMSVNFLNRAGRPIPVNNNGRPIEQLI